MPGPATSCNCIGFSLAFGGVGHSAWSLLGTAAGSLHPLQAIPRSYTATEVVGVLQRSGSSTTVWMSQQALLAEVQSLRRDLAELSLRVLALESRDLGDPAESAGRSAPASPLVINYTGGGAALPLPPFPSGSQATPSSPPCSTWQSPSSTNSPPAVLTDAERRRIAEEAGRFLRQALAGELRGTSGRERVRLSSRVYLLLRDFQGNVYPTARVFRSWAAIQPLVKPHGYCGDSVFIGWPSLWEAKVCCEAAGHTWPPDERV